jgi:hypothetical protein
MIKWEYCILYPQGNPDVNSTDIQVYAMTTAGLTLMTKLAPSAHPSLPHALAAMLATLGAEGWELAGEALHGLGEFQGHTDNAPLVFKRPLE